MKYVKRSTVYHRGGLILEPDDRVAVKYVTVIGYDNDFAVYMSEGWKSDDDVAAGGDKVSADVARVVAPYCSHLMYRD